MAKKQFTELDEIEQLEAIWNWDEGTLIKAKKDSQY